jgi:hypothetical protein
MLDYLEFFLNTERLLSLLLITIVIGFGLWFSRSGWPFLSEYLKQAQRLNHELKLQRLSAELASDERWQETTSEMAASFAALKEELGAFRETLRSLLQHKPPPG